MSTLTMHPLVAGIILLLLSQLILFALWLIRVHSNIKVIGVVVHDIKTNCLPTLSKTVDDNLAQARTEMAQLRQTVIDHLLAH